jgi:hypothetical protein
VDNETKIDILLLTANTSCIAESTVQGALVAYIGTEIARQIISFLRKA